MKKLPRGTGVVIFRLNFFVNQFLTEILKPLNRVNTIFQFLALNNGSRALKAKELTNKKKFWPQFKGFKMFKQ